MAARLESRCSGSLLTGLAVAATATAVAWLWIGLQPVTPSFTTLDLFHLFYPGHTYIGAEFAHGRIPEWNPYIGFGANVLAEPQLGPWYPPNWLYAVLPPALALDVLAWFHVFVGAAGIYFLCRDAGLGVASASVGSAVLAIGGPLQTASSWPTMAATFSWCPLAILLGRRLAAGPGVSPALALAGVYALQILAGYFQLHLYTACAVGLFALFASPRTVSAWTRLAVWLVLVEAFALALSAVQILPSMAAVPSSIRSIEFMDRSYYEVFPVGLTDFRRSVAAGPSDGTLPIYAGVVASVLALAGWLPLGRSSALRAPVTALLVVSLVLSLGSATPVFPLLWRTPIANWLTGPYKWTYMMGLAIALGAAVGTEALFGTSPPRRTVWLVWVALGIALLLAVPFSPTMRAAGGIFLAAAFVMRERLSVAVPLIVGLAALAGIHGRPPRPRDVPEMFARYEDVYAAVRSRGDGGRVFSILPETRFPMRQGEIERVQTLNTYETLYPIRTFRLRAALSAAVGAPAQRPFAVAAMRALGVHYVLSGHYGGLWLAGYGFRRMHASPGADAWESPKALPRAYIAGDVQMADAADALRVLFEGTLADRSAVLLEQEEGAVLPPAAAGRATIVRDDPTEVRLVVDAAGPGVLVLLDAWSPDWRATVDGTPVRIRHANYLGRAIEVPSGRHHVTFRFSSRPFHLGATITLLAFAAALGWCCRQVRHRMAGDRRPS